MLLFAENNAGIDLMHAWTYTIQQDEARCTGLGKIEYRKMRRIKKIRQDMARCSMMRQDIEVFGSVVQTGHWNQNCST